jgi:uncharacterized protein (DUF2147 family)
MKKIIASLCLITLASVGTSATASAKAPIEGRWKNGSMEIVIGPCGQSLCGTVVKASSKQQAKAEAGSGTDLIGATLIRNIRPAGAGSYRANVFVADRNINASGTIRMINRNQLDVKGCAYLVICKSKTWERVR